MSYFRGNVYGSGWDCDDLQYYYGAEISALSINDNVLQLSAKPGEREGASARSTAITVVLQMTFILSLVAVTAAVVGDDI